MTAETVAPTFNFWRDPESVRECYDYLRTDYRMSKESRFTSRLTGANVSGSGADYHYRSESDWLRMMERSRHYGRNDQIIAAGLRRLSANVMGEGFTPHPETGNAELDVLQRAAWLEWSEDPDQCDSEGERCWAEMEEQCFLSTITDGDIFALPLDTGHVQLVEAHRCRTPHRTRRNVVHGILLEAGTAARLEYWFTRDDVSPWRVVQRVGDMQRVAARRADGTRQVLHVVCPARPSQRRGVPLISPASDTVGMLDDLQFVRLVREQVTSMIALIHERAPSPAPEPGGDSEPTKGEQTVEDLGKASRLVETIGPAMEVFGEPGEKITAFSAPPDGGTYVPYSRLLMMMLANNLDLPLAVLLLDSSASNFSGWNGAVREARKSWRKWQRRMIQRLHRPIWRWRMRQEAGVNTRMRKLMEALPASQAYRCDWSPTPWPYVDQLKDGQADALQESRGLNSMRRLLAARQLDIETVQDEIIDDRARFVARCMAKADEIGCDWRDLARPLGIDRTTAAHVVDATDKETDE